ncbi:hypothetical protein [Hymenobacter glacieicola]|uniref:Uncharacterized protein n=1 Tax=Hymenobacter glacieicola TaxID=1562124 RepID=A0ABQ1WLU5_9BACT|nr:hypothetical protein [Hymenobacter glacieicola]GGG35699.1 hypothetical protein GCM10011378_09950 [Hymenobacter glacieicola]
MPSAATRPQPCPSRAGYCNRRATLPERELSVSLFGGCRQVPAAVTYYASWVSTGSFPARVPQVQVRGVWALPSGACLLSAIGHTQRAALAEQLEQLLLREGEW